MNCFNIMYYNALLTVYCIICGQRVYQKAFLNYVNTYLFSNFFSIVFARWKNVGVTPHCLYPDLLTLIT